MSWSSRRQTNLLPRESGIVCAPVAEILAERMAFMASIDAPAVSTLDKWPQVRIPNKA